jgi:Universal stress protein family
MNGSGGGQGRIVVGIDGSENSKEALRYAARQARFTGAEAEAVIVWQYPVFYGWAAPYPDNFDLAQIGQQVLTEVLDEVLGPDLPARLRTRVVEGHAAQVRSWSRCRQAPTCWSWAAAGTARSPICFSARSAPTASTTPTAPSL